MTTFYAQSEQEVIQLIEEYSKKGFEFKPGMENPNYVFGSLRDDVIETRHKCDHCNGYISKGIRLSHGSQCEHCQKILHLEVKKSDRVSFRIKGDKSLNKYTLLVHSYDQKNEQLFFYTEKLPRQDWLFSLNPDEFFISLIQQEIGEFLTIEDDEVFQVAYSFKNEEQDHFKINVCDIEGGYEAFTCVKIYEGKEYEETLGLIELPIPTSIGIYRDWNIKKDAKEILQRSGLNSRPQYYSGRGAILADLTSNHLERVHEKISTWVSVKAAEEFVNMVIDIPIMSATDFIIAFYRLEKNNWIWDNALLKGLSGTSFDDTTGAFATVISAMSSKRNDTHEIKYPFLLKQGREMDAYQDDMLFMDVDDEYWA